MGDGGYVAWGDGDGGIRGGKRLGNGKNGGGGKGARGSECNPLHSGTRGRSGDEGVAPVVPSAIRSTVRGCRICIRIPVGGGDAGGDGGAIVEGSWGA